MPLSQHLNLLNSSAPNPPSFKSPLLFDMRALEHPKPLEIMTKALIKASEGEILLMIHRKEPFLLYEIIQSRHLCYHTTQEGENFFILIAKEEILHSFLTNFLPPNTLFSSWGDIVQKSNQVKTSHKDL